MKKVQFYVTDVLKAVAPIFFTLVSLGAAFLSGIIEFVVVKDILGMGENNYYLPMILIIVFEFTKWYLHYLIPRLKLYPAKGMNVDVLSLIKTLLVSVSIICTIIFSVNSLFYNVNDIRVSENESLITEINEQHRLAVNALQQKHNDELAQRTQFYDDQIKQAQLNLSEHLNNNAAYYNDWTRINWEKDKAALESNVSNAVTEREVQISQYKAQLEDKMNREIAALELVREENIKGADSVTKLSHNGDIPIIRNFLLFIAELFGLASYSRVAYGLFSVGVALVFGIALELIISVGQNYLSLDRKSLERIVDENNDADDGKSKAIVKLLVSCALSMAVFLVFGLLNEQVLINKSNIIVITVCYIGVSLCGKFIEKRSPSQNHAHSDLPVSTAATATKTGVIAMLNRLGFVHDVDSAKQDIFVSLMKSALAFCAFIVVGIVWGSEAPDAVTSLGVATGSFVGNMMMVKL